MFTKGLNPMDDTSPEMAKKMREMIQMKSPLERLNMGCSMHATSKQLIINAILKADPTITQAKLKQEIFLKFYSDDYNSSEKTKILSHLNQL